MLTRLFTPRLLHNIGFQIQGYGAVLFCILVYNTAFSQVHHYETIVYEDDTWRYRLADSEPTSTWMQPSFDDATWTIGIGGFGYGDNDDNTIIPPGNGIYLRTYFNITNLSLLEQFVLDADYDDAFVAYLNGVEIARANIGTIGISPAFDDMPDTYHEAGLFDGLLPERFILDNNIPLLNQGSNTLAIHVLNFDANSSDLSGRFFLSAGISDAVYEYGDVPFWFEPYTSLTSSNLPLIIIDTDGQEIPNEPSIVATMGIIDNGSGNLNYPYDPYNNYDGQISIEVRGASSQSFPKKGYRIETQDDAGNNNNVALLGMPSENDWVLYGPYSDKTLIRNVLSYDLGAWTGRYAPRTRFCELILNDEYRGVYVLTEKIKRDANRVDMANVTPSDIEGDELTGGYLLQIDRENETIPEEGWYSNNGFYPYYYVVEDPKYDVILPVQRNYIENYINTFEQAMVGTNAANQYQNYLDVGALADYFIVNELAKHIDAFKLSFYMHKQKDSNGGKLVLGPIWDFNLGYGNFDFGCDPAPSGWIYQCTTPTIWLGNVLNIPAVQDSIHCRWTELRETVYTTDNIMGHIDSLTNLLSDAQQRNFEKFDVIGTYVWPNDFIGQSYGEEVNFLKNFIQVRLQWMDNNMLGSANDCNVSTSIIEPENEVLVDIFPNPCSDVVTVQFSNDDSPKAVLNIYTIKGKLVATKSISSKETLKVTTNNWKSGLYLYNIHLDGKIFHAGTLEKF